MRGHHSKTGAGGRKCDTHDVVLVHPPPFLDFTILALGLADVEKLKIKSDLQFHTSSSA